MRRLIERLSNRGLAPGCLTCFFSIFAGYADWRLRNHMCFNFCQKEEYYQHYPYPDNRKKKRKPPENLMEMYSFC